MRAGPAILLAAVVGAGLSGCGDDAADPLVEAETGIAAVLVERLLVAEADVQVRCPRDLEVVAGATFACDVTVEGVDASLDLKVADDGTVELREAVIPTAEAEAYLADELAVPADGPVEPDCGEAPLLVTPVDTEFRCTVVRSVDGQSRTVVVTVLALDGTVRYRVEPAAAVPDPSTAP